MPPFQRSETGTQLRLRQPQPPRHSTSSLTRRSQTASTASSPLKRLTIKVYNLKWERLQSLLREWFPDCKFEERRVNRTPVGGLAAPKATDLRVCRYRKTFVWSKCHKT